MAAYICFLKKYVVVKLMFNFGSGGGKGGQTSVSWIIQGFMVLYSLFSVFIGGVESCLSWLFHRKQQKDDSLLLPQQY